MAKSRVCAGRVMEAGVLTSSRPRLLQGWLVLTGEGSGSEAPSSRSGSSGGSTSAEPADQHPWSADSDTSQVFSAAVARAAGRSSAVALVLMQVPSCFLLRIKGSARKSVVVPPTWVPGTGSLRTSSSFVRRTSGILAVLQAAF